MAYCTSSDVYRLAGISSSVVSEENVNEHILEAQSEIDLYFNTTFETASVTETLDGNGTNKLMLMYYPISSLTSLTIDGTSVTTSKVYLYSNIGKIQLKSDAEQTVFLDTEPQQVVITYVYGYNWDFSNIYSNPKAYVIRKLCSIIAGKMSLIAQIGGTYDDVTSYNLPEFSASKGEPYTNIREALTRLDNEYKRLVESEAYKSLQRNINFV